MVKRFSLLAIIMLIMLVFSGCVKENVDTSKLNIVTSFYPMYIATVNIVDGIEDVELRNLTESTTGCLHDYQLTTSNMITLSTADILIVNGGGMENFIDKVKETYDFKIINASEGILEDTDINGFNPEEASNDETYENANSKEIHEHGENAHIWVSISMYIKQVENISKSLAEIDSKNSEKYMQNAETYIEKLNDLKDRMHTALDNVENKEIITFHEAFSYFADEFNLDIVAVIEREPGTYPSAGEVAQIIDLVREKDVKAIFVEPQYSRSAADTIARETGVNVYTLDPIVTGDLEKDAYINIMNQNLETLQQALT